ncbi:hypothetical protein FJT64_009445 [Amphibalanus amphitrite]|uniref:Tyr recombinase domain-containing protein n=1 Tax=Amphibalanus amphitrite TaxID=1232801 RepID=A0A6A4VTC6_AMPAM|nr:hypothetical protein FJT64_009445 [Amphibalanus amphitrite]
MADAGLTRDGRLTTHSLRIGFATAAAAAGVSESVIRVSGRWRGSSYLSTEPLMGSVPFLGSITEPEVRLDTG